MPAFLMHVSAMKSSRSEYTALHLQLVLLAYNVLNLNKKDKTIYQ